MTIHTCPLCALRFEFRTELEWHLAEDHDCEWASPSRGWANQDNRRPKVPGKGAR